MHKHSDFVAQAAKINENFRKEIRKREIDRRFSQRRKQLMQQMRNAKISNNSDSESAQTDVNYIIDQTTEDSSRIIREFQKIYQSFIQKHILTTQKQLGQLAGISCTITGVKLILSVEKTFLEYLQREFIQKKNYDNTMAQSFVLLVFTNCLAIADIGHSLDSNLKYAYLNQLSISQSFLMRLFTISLQSNLSKSKNNALSCIFNVIFNNDYNFAQALVMNNPKQNIIAFLFNYYTQCAPKKQQVIELLRIFYIIMKKLEFPNLQQFGKMRKLIIQTLKMSNHKQMTIVAIVCLHSFLRCLPNEKATIIKSGILPIIYSQAISLNNQRIANHALRIISVVLPQKHDEQTKQVLQEIVSFLEAVANTYSSDDVYHMLFKIVYQVLVHTHYNCESFINKHKRLMSKMMDIFLSNFTKKQILIEIANILPIVAFKAKNTIQKALIVNIKTRLRQLLDSNYFDEMNSSFLQQALDMLPDTEELNQYL